MPAGIGETGGEVPCARIDFLARYGGEELVIILPGSIVEDARRIAEKIRDRIDKTRFDYQDQVIRLTISLGVTQATPADSSAEKLFERVDKAMYHAKRRGPQQGIGCIIGLRPSARDKSLTFKPSRRLTAAEYQSSTYFSSPAAAGAVTTVRFLKMSVGSNPGIL